METTTPSKGQTSAAEQRERNTPQPEQGIRDCISAALPPRLSHLCERISVQLWHAQREACRRWSSGPRRAPPRKALLGL